MNETPLGVDVAQTMLYEKRSLLERGLPIEAIRDPFYPLFFDNAQLNNVNSLFSKKQDNLTPLLHGKILGRTVVSFPRSGRAAISYRSRDGRSHRVSPGALTQF